MQAFEDMIGNDALRAGLADELRHDKLTHAYILEGPVGSGKHTLARQIAAALSCQHRYNASAPLPCKECASCRKILSGNSPDLISIRKEEDKATFGVEVIRSLRNDVFIAPNDTDYKVYLIEDAHLMTEQAQNAFLLTLEEPPSYVLFLLLCEDTAHLLDTIRSRALTLRTEALPTDRIDAYLQRTSSAANELRRTNPTEYGAVLLSCNGYIGQALTLLDPTRRRPIIARRKRALDFLALCRNKKAGAMLQFIKELGQKRDEIAEQLEVILLSLRDLLLCKQSDTAPLCFFFDREEASSLAYEFTIPELLQLCDGILNTVERLRMNANVRLTLTAFAVRTGLLRI